MANQSLHDVMTIRAMAEAVARRTSVSPTEGDALADAYERARTRAKRMFERAWPDDADTFDDELPPVSAFKSSGRRLPLGMQSQQPLIEAVARGEQAVVYASQLAAWALGHQEAFELEARLEVDAKAKAAAAREASKKGPTGFSSS